MLVRIAPDLVLDADIVTRITLEDYETDAARFAAEDTLTVTFWASETIHHDPPHAITWTFSHEDMGMEYEHLTFDYIVNKVMAGRSDNLPSYYATTFTMPSEPTTSVVPMSLDEIGNASS